MTDFEITRLCAEALLPNVWAHGEWNPLHDDAQAMALVKKFQLAVAYLSPWYVSCSPYQVHADDLNRAICECVARMQQSKHPT